jgi:hypothetical protein
MAGYNHTKNTCETARPCPLVQSQVLPLHLGSFPSILVAPHCTCTQEVPSQRYSPPCPPPNPSIQMSTQMPRPQRSWLLGPLYLKSQNTIILLLLLFFTHSPTYNTMNKSYIHIVWFSPTKMWDLHPSFFFYEKYCTFHFYLENISVCKQTHIDKTSQIHTACYLYTSGRNNFNISRWVWLLISVLNTAQHSKVARLYPKLTTQLKFPKIQILYIYIYSNCIY